ncbi:adenylate/guanylate cyclase domain-containing protein [Aquipuribacter nitratireducens]|uniref:Adenylate/guanylate cyclase domain-containing protein n=1 Tax=Aquipuribacter nitratireducens TaxID=650104 RepID=A0ABW0GHG7_9MICO
MAERRRFAYSSTALLLAAAVLALPVAGLGLLLARPALDVRWQHQPSHFWLVLGAAGLSAVLAYGTGSAALRRGDPRVLFVSLAFLASAGFLALHALATPGVLLPTPNAGFVLATPVGIALGSLAASASGIEPADPVRWVRWGRRLRLLLVALMVLWAVLSLSRAWPLHEASVPERADGVLAVLAVPAFALYALAAGRYAVLWWRRRSLMLLSVLAAWVLLGEAMLAVLFARDWALSWWEWHVLLLAAYAAVAVGARLQWHEERYADLYSGQTAAGHRDMSVLFADLQGFTAYSEAHEPEEVATMLNTYFAVTVPQVARRFGGDVDRIIGDAIMVTFNRRGDQPDHARRAAAAGLALQAAASRVARDRPGWPRFRVGVNTGPVTVGLLGTEGGRTHTVVGDTVNVASRIEGTAPVGAVAIGPGTLAALPGARTEQLGAIVLKGRSEPVEVHRLIDLTDRADEPAS